MYPPLCGEVLEIHARLGPPRGVLIPQTAQAGLESLRCIHRSVGRNGKVKHTRPPHGVSLSPKRPRQDRRDSGLSAAVWGEMGRSFIPDPLTGRPYPPNGPGRCGGTRVYPPLCGHGTVAWGASPYFTEYLNFPVCRGSGGGWRPHGHETVAWGASPYFTEYPNFPICRGSGGMAPPTDMGPWLWGPPLISRNIQTSLSAEVKGGMAPSTDLGSCLGGPPCTSWSLQTSLSAASQGGMAPPIDMVS